MMKRFRFRALTAIAVLVAAVGLVVSVVPGILNRWIVAAWSEPPRTYQATQDMPFLTDDAALLFATRLMRDEGKGDGWEPRKDHRTKSPDGTPDVYLVRNAFNPNRGFICFRHGRGDRQLSVDVKYDAKARTIECQTQYQK
jgi:hypothetical protein